MNEFVYMCNNIQLFSLIGFLFGFLWIMNNWLLIPYDYNVIHVLDQCVLITISATMRGDYLQLGLCLRHQVTYSTFSEPGQAFENQEISVFTTH